MMGKKHIYALQHNVTKRIYIGSSANPGARYRNHISLLRNHKHKVEDLQADYDKYGADFSLFILDEIESQNTRAKEYEYMEKYQSHIRGRGYNYKDKLAICHRESLDIPFKEGLPEMPVQNV